MKAIRIAVASGKGGTGKTTIAVNMALATNSFLADCDVEEPNAHLFIKPSFTEKEISVLVPEIDESKCNLCGRCKDVCQYNALLLTKKKVLFFEQMCHSCGGCKIACPLSAITEKEKRIGFLRESPQMSDALLDIGVPSSPPLIRSLKKSLSTDKIVIIDAPPGASCPAVTAVYDCDYCILVSEPTPFGLHDLEVAVKMLRDMNIQHGVVINRANLGNNNLRDYCKRENIEVLLEIDFDKQIALAYSRGENLIDSVEGYKEKMLSLFSRVSKIVEDKNELS